MAITDSFVSKALAIGNAPYVPNNTPPIPGGASPSSNPIVPSGTPPIPGGSMTPTPFPTVEAAPSNYPNEVPAEFGAQTHDNLGGIKPPVALPDPTNYSLPDAIAMGATFLTEIASGLAVCFLIWGAISFALAAGDEEKIDHAKAIMKWSIFGLIIALFALTVVTLVQNAVGTRM